jgi:hypothetical protein
MQRPPAGVGTFVAARNSVNSCPGTSDRWLQPANVALQNRERSSAKRGERYLHVKKSPRFLLSL